MMYFDARLAADFPTIEIRIADVCTDPDDAVLIAALGRALVETAAREWSAGTPPAAWRTDALRAARLVDAMAESARERRWVDTSALVDG